MNMTLQRSSATMPRFTCSAPSPPTSSRATTTSPAAIGTTEAARAGAAMLCYVTPRSTLDSPRPRMSRPGYIAYKIAAHAGDIARGIAGRGSGMMTCPAPVPPSTGPKCSNSPSTAKPPAPSMMRIWKSTPTSAAMCGHDWCSMRQQGNPGIRLRQGREFPAPQNRHPIHRRQPGRPRPPQTTRRPHPGTNPRPRPQGEEGGVHSDKVVDKEEAKLGLRSTRSKPTAWS